MHGSLCGSVVIGDQHATPLLSRRAKTKRQQGEGSNSKVVMSRPATALRTTKGDPHNEKREKQRCTWMQKNCVANMQKDQIRNSMKTMWTQHQHDTVEGHQARGLETSCQAASRATGRANGLQQR
ncbi:uncharacterized protein UTRI_02821 [Ustilago trichophora]|uniref:Uncharacterized protein n=1 Tax=Ustilago trichophora TaxID=86804 RepID=A0A5C3ENP6_9BASI|nr:uncharacterized protein UTRI_02821 [Ustilago trichophora]